MFALIYFILSTFLVTIFSFYINTFVYNGSLIPNTHNLINLPNLPAAVWIFLAMLILNFIASFFIFINSFNVKRLRAKYKKDTKNFSSLIYNNILGLEIKKSFNTDEFKKLNSILALFKFIPKKDFFVNSFLEKNIRDVFEGISEVNAGRVIDTAKFKKLKDNSYLYEQNSLNILNSSEVYEEKLIKNILNDTLKNRLDRSSELIDVALTTLIKNSKSCKEVLKYKDLLNKNYIFKVYESSTIKLNIDDVKQLFKLDIKFSEKEYIKLANLISNKISIDKAINLFENQLIKSDAISYGGYIFLLCKFKLYNKAKNILSLFNVEEYKIFRTFLKIDNSDDLNVNIEDLFYF